MGYFHKSSHSSNPSSPPQGYVEFRYLGHVGGGKGVEGTPCRGLLRHTLAEFWSNQANVEGIVLALG